MFSIVLFTAISVLCALIEVTLVPLRHGTTVVPLTVPLAILSNIVVPTLSRRAVPLTVAAVLPVVAWLLTVILLSQARPEGDLLLIGTAPLVDVTYALLGLGLVSGLATVIRGQHAGLAERRDAWPDGTGGRRSTAGPGTPGSSSGPAGSTGSGRPRSPTRPASPSSPTSPGSPTSSSSPTSSGRSGSRVSSGRSTGTPKGRSKRR